MGFPHYPGDCADHHHVVVDFEHGTRPTIVTLCGSTRFPQDFADVQRDLTLEGVIVIPPGVWVRSDPAFADVPDPVRVKESLDELHLRKIDLSDAIFVINVGGYIGESTAREVAYAYAHRKKVIYLEHEGDDVYAPVLPRSSAVDGV